MEKKLNKSLMEFVQFLEELYENLENEKREVILNNLKQVNNKLMISFKSISPERMRDLGMIQLEIKNIIKIIKKTDEEIEEKSEIFIDYPILSEYIEAANLNMMDIYQIVTFFINRNIKLCIKEDSVIIDMKLLKKMRFETMDINDLINLMASGKINAFFNKDELTDLEKKQIEEINRRLPEFTHSLSEIRKHTDNFDKYILSKMPNITLEDILEAKIALRGLKYREYVIERVIAYLLKIYEKNLKNNKEIFDEELNEIYINMLFPINKDKNGEIICDEVYLKNIHHQKFIADHNALISHQDKPVEKRESVKKYLTEAEVRTLKKSIRRFYNLYTIELTGIPNYQELIQIISDMEKLEVDANEIKRYLTILLKSCDLPDNFITSKHELLNLINKFITYKVSGEEINSFIRKYRKNFHKTYDNAVDEYLDRIEEIKFYDAEVADDIADLYQELSSSSEDDYLIIVSMIQEYLDMLNKYSSSVAYEYSQAKNLK